MAKCQNKIAFWRYPSRKAKKELAFWLDYELQVTYPYNLPTIDVIRHKTIHKSVAKTERNVYGGSHTCVFSIGQECPRLPPTCNSPSWEPTRMGTSLGTLFHNCWNTGKLNLKLTKINKQALPQEALY